MNWRAFGPLRTTTRRWDKRLRNWSRLQKIQRNWLGRLYLYLPRYPTFIYSFFLSLSLSPSISYFSISAKLIKAAEDTEKLVRNHPKKKKEWINNININKWIIIINKKTLPTCTFSSFWNRPLSSNSTNRGRGYADVELLQLERNKTTSPSYQNIPAAIPLPPFITI